MDVFDALTPLAAKRLRASALDAYAQAYFDRLRVQGYAALTVRLYLNCLAHFALWSVMRRFDLTSFDRHAECFVLQHLPRCSCAGPVQCTAHCVRAALKHFKAVIVDAGIVVAGPADPIDTVLQRFDGYLQRIRGLAASTRRQRLAIIRPLASMAGGCLPSPELVRRFLHQQLSHLTPASAHVTTTAMRSWLRFLAFEGERVEQLLPLVASPANWRLAPLPQTLTQPEIERLLDAFPTDLPSQLRCLAIMRCVVDLGLRSSEVIALEFDDIDWTAGTVRIGKAKSRRVDKLPLPQATGAAIAQYVRKERPCTTSSRRIFVRHVAPMDAPVTASVVRRTVREAYRRAGLPYTRVHILRHTLASRLLNSGGTLKEVADVLRHRELDTSLIYAKVDIAHLHAVAMPWPGSNA